MNPMASGRALVACGALALLVLFGGCASTPPTRLYSLTAPPTAAPATPPQRLLRLDRVQVPAGLDGNEWRVRDADGTLHLLEQQRWSSPLPDELRAALVAALADRGVLARQTAAPPEPRLSIELLRFDSVLGAEVVQELVWTLHGAGPQPLLQCLRRQRERASGGYAALAEAHRRAWSAFAAEVADVLQRPPAGQPLRCP